MVLKPTIRQNPSTGQWELYRPELEDADCYIAVTNRNQFTVVKTAEEAEEFLAEDGGSIYAVTHYEHNDETLPQSHFYKEVEVGNRTEN